MNPYRLNPRRLRLLKRVLKGLRPDVASLRFLYNHIRWALLNKEKSTKVPPPVNLILELSARCNLHCIMCARESRYGKEMDQGFMPPDKAKAVIDQALPYLTSIGLTGLGETFLYPHLEEICRYIKTRKPNVVITCSTNAHFHGFLEKLDKAIPYIDNLQISVDGVGKVYETIRPATDFSFIKQNILRTAEACRKYDVELKFNLVAMPQNIDNLKDVKVLKIRGNNEVTAYKPYQAYIFDGSYPLYRSVYMVSTAPGGTVTHRFYSFVTGFQGQKIIQMTGILPATVRPRMVELE